MALVGIVSSLGAVDLIDLVDDVRGCGVDYFLGEVFLFSLLLLKTPIFMLHLWLTKAHVEAPTGASMILAGVLLKLGVYGILKYKEIARGPRMWVCAFQVLGI